MFCRDDKMDHHVRFRHYETDFEERAREGGLPITNPTATAPSAHPKVNTFLYNTMISYLTYFRKITDLVFK